jgi:hypothetical protein
MKKKYEDILNRIFRALNNPKFISWKMRTNVARKINIVIKNTVLKPMLSLSSIGNIVMFHIGRSGSTLLGDMLRQHPKIYWDGEIYNSIIKKLNKTKQDKYKKDATEFFNKFLFKRMCLSGKNKFYGFELKFFHLKFFQVELPFYINYLENLGFKHFIVLERKNYLRKIVSSVVAHQSSIWHQPAKTNSLLSSVYINIEKLKLDGCENSLFFFLQQYEKDFLILKKILKHYNVLWLTYEGDILNGPFSAYLKITNFLNINQHKVSIRYGRTNPFKLERLIENFEDVEQNLRGTRFEWMLYD